MAGPLAHLGREAVAGVHLGPADPQRDDAHLDLTVRGALRQRLQLDKARLVELEDVLQVSLVKAPAEDAAVLAVKEGLLVNLDWC